jgi:hypothetical protein
METRPLISVEGGGGLLRGGATGSRRGRGKTASLTDTLIAVGILSFAAALVAVSLANRSVPLFHRLSRSLHPPPVFRSPGYSFLSQLILTVAPIPPLILIRRHSNGKVDWNAPSAYPFKPMHAASYDTADVVGPDRYATPRHRMPSVFY